MTAAVVHATGVNWESVGVIVAIIAMLQGGLAFVLARRDRQRDQRDARRDERDKEMRQEIADSVNHLSDVLLAKLETKETVARISERLARVEGAAGLKVQP